MRWKESIKGKGKAVLTHAMKGHIGGLEVYLQSYLTLRLGGGGWAALCTHPPPQEKSPWYPLNWMLGELQNQSEYSEEQTNLSPCQELNSRSSSLQLRHYTDWAIPATIASSIIKSNNKDASKSNSFIWTIILTTFTLFLQKVLLQNSEWSVFFQQRCLWVHHLAWWTSQEEIEQ